jgi:transcriptional regulator with XRE-family HTH domain
MGNYQMDEKAFGGRLKELRGAAKLTQRELADKSGIPMPTLRRWEQGQNEPGFSALVALADTLGISLDDFRPPTSKTGRRKTPAPK